MTNVIMRFQQVDVIYIQIVQSQGILAMLEQQQKRQLQETITAPSTITIKPSEELGVVDYRTYKTVKAKIIKNFKTIGTFLVDSGEPMSSFKANEVVNILPPNTEGKFGEKRCNIFY